MSPNHDPNQKQQNGPHVQNIFVDSFLPINCANPISSNPSCCQPPNGLLTTDTSSINYFVPQQQTIKNNDNQHSFGRHQNCTSQIESANFTEEQICRRSLLRICILGIFLIIFVFIVYKVIENEVTKRIQERQKGKTIVDH